MAIMPSGSPLGFPSGLFSYLNRIGVSPEIPFFLTGRLRRRVQKEKRAGTPRQGADRPLEPRFTRRTKKVSGREAGARGVPAFSFFLSCTAAGGVKRGAQELLVVLIAASWVQVLLEAKLV